MFASDIGMAEALGHQNVVVKRFITLAGKDVKIIFQNKPNFHLR